jgi:hypothetical protein
VELDNDSKWLCKLNTRRAVYKYLRSPYWVKLAPRILQEFIYNMLALLPFSTAYLDDNFLVSHSWYEHMRRLHDIRQNKQLRLSLAP